MTLCTNMVFTFSITTKILRLKKSIVKYEYFIKFIILLPNKEQSPKEKIKLTVQPCFYLTIFNDVVPTRDCMLCLNPCR